MDTIAAIATPLGNGGISIIRLSGNESFNIISKVFKDLSEVKTHTIHYGKFYDLLNNEIDEVLVSVFRAPRSYTTEDVIEINCHGGIINTTKILNTLLEAGARLALPGEFTKRAFLNGRIDLTQAEAVMDVINALNDHSLEFAQKALRGDIYQLINTFRLELLNCIGKIEVNIDYPEYETENEITNDLLLPTLLDLKNKLSDILNKALKSINLVEGITTAIVGKPNVGKSSLLNALVRENKAIVTPIEGTTRDIVEGKININGVILKLLDTAGIRKTDDVIEQIGIDKTFEAINKASLVILIFDNSLPLSASDIELINITKEKNRILIINKTDLNKAIKLEPSLEKECLEMSLLNNNSIDLLENKIIEVMKLNDLSDTTIITNARQIDLIKKSLNHINEAINSCHNFMPVDIVNVDIKNAWILLGEIIGEACSEDLINHLFANFCLGK